MADTDAARLAYWLMLDRSRQTCSLFTLPLIGRYKPLPGLHFFYDHLMHSMLLLLKTWGAVTSFFKAQRTVLLDLSENHCSLLSPWKTKHRSASHRKQNFFPFSFVFVCFPLHPHRMVVFVSVAHQVQPTRQVQGERVTCDGEG